MEARKLIISGYYGFGNSGDEAVLWSILTALEAEGEKAGIPLQPIVLSNDPAKTRELFGVEAVPRAHLRSVVREIREADGLISGGGSLLQDVTGPKTIPYYLGIIHIAQWYAKPTFIYAQGVGPVRRPLFRRMIGNVLKKCTYISVRDAESADLLAECGLDRERIDVVPDPVIGAPRGEALFKYAGSDSVANGNSVTSTNRASALPLIGVSVRFWNEDESELRAIADALKQVASTRPVRIRMLPFYPPGDVQASKRIVDQLLADERFVSTSVVEIAPNREHPAAMMRETANCDVLVGMRLHSLIYAAAQGVPMVGISYDPKVDVFLKQIDTEAAIRTGAPDAARLAQEIMHRLDAGADWMASRAAKVEALRQKCMVPAQQICRFFRI